MNKALKAAKAGLTKALAVKETVSAALHPVQWVKDKLVELMALALLEGLKKTVGPELAKRALDQLNVVGRTLPFELKVPVPGQAQSLLAEDSLRVAQDVANEVLAGPLELLGYKMAKTTVRYDADAGNLCVAFEVGLMRAQPAGCALLAQPEVSTTGSLPAAVDVAVPGSTGT